MEAGITLLDTADTYGDRGGSESMLGKVLRGRRNNVVLATKFGSDMGGGESEARGSREYIREAVKASLRRLDTDWIDLYQFHRPDPLTPIEETLGALNELLDEGLVREIGSSNFSADQLREAATVAATNGWRPFASLQNKYSLLEREIEHEVLPECERLGVAVLPYFPLASGLLTGKHLRGQPAPAGSRIALRGAPIDDATLDRLEALVVFAEDRRITPTDVAIGALLAQPALVSVIAGATSAEQVCSNAAGARWSPSLEDLAELDTIFPPGVLGASVPRQAQRS